MCFILLFDALLCALLIVMVEFDLGYHYPVMTKEVGQFVVQKAQECVDEGRKIAIFDGTLGHGGHVKYFFDLLGETIGLYVATDMDIQMFSAASARLHEVLNPSYIHCLKLYNTTYTDFAVILGNLKKENPLTTGYDVLFLDLGVNLWHFKLPERGFSIKGDGSLDMRYDAVNNPKTAADIVNTYGEQELIDIFVQNSEITFDTSKKIAQAIISFRKNNFFSTTDELNMLIKKIGYSARVAAIVFQAIRIEVNKEFTNIRYVLDNAHMSMNPGGILIILSYHSGEDRIVKEMMKKMQDEQRGIVLTKHTQKPSFHEISRNKPSRSAQLRVFKYY